MVMYTCHLSTEEAEPGTEQEGSLNPAWSMFQAIQRYIERPISKKKKIGNREFSKTLVQYPFKGLVKKQSFVL